MNRKRVAIIDDDRSIVELLDALLSEEGYDTSCWNSGVEAWEGIKREIPQLVIVDLQMEHKEAGLEVLRRIRTEPSTQHIPVILYSADTRFLRQKVKELNDDNCMTLEKPFELIGLLNRIELATQGKELSR